MKRRGLLIPLFLAIAACGNPGPPLTVSGISVIAPLPGRAETVAYMTIHNQSSARLSVHRFASPQFQSIEMHATITSNGIASMQRIDALPIDAGSSIELASGGKHLMLLDPLRGLVPGQPVTIEIHFDDGGLLIVDAPLGTRRTADSGN